MNNDITAEIRALRSPLRLVRSLWRFTAFIILATCCCLCAAIVLVGLGFIAKLVWLCLLNGWHTL